MKRYIPMVGSLVLLCWSALSGCSQSQDFYSDKDGFTMDYPTVGQDISGVIQDILNRQGDPRTNKNATNGPVTFRVLSAKVIKADDVVPTRDWRGSSVLFQGHVTMFLPNGQSVECDDFEGLYGTWQNGRCTGLYIDEVGGGAYVYGNPPDLDDLQPTFLQTLQHSMTTGGPELGVHIMNACSIENLFWELRGHDLVHPQYPFSTWLEANRLAMAHTDLIFGAPKDNPLRVPSPSTSPVVQAPPPQPPATGRAIVENYNLFVTGTIHYTIPITDQAWLKYKSSLFTPRFDTQSWTAMAATMPRLQLEQHLHDVMATALEASQRKARAEHGPLVSRIAQAAYVAQQPDATQSQKDTAARLSHEGETQLGSSTRHLLAFKILIDAIQADVDAQNK